MVDDKKITDVLESSERAGINGRRSVQTAIGAGTLVTLAWYAFLVFLAVSVGVIPTILVGLYVAGRMIALFRSAAALEEQMDRLIAAKAEAK